MIEDKPIDLDIENTKLNNELVVLRARYNELDEDRHYIKSLLDAEFEKRNKLEKENEQLKKDVEYWKRVASQYSNELNVFEHCKRYKTECKDIYWSIKVM